MTDEVSARVRAARVNACAELRDVRLLDVTSKLSLVPNTLQNLTYTFEGTIQVQRVAETSGLIVDGTYELRVVLLEDGGEITEESVAAASEILKLNFKLAAFFAADVPKTGPAEFSDVELDSFGETTGRLALHPYAREFIADISGRMGLPSLHIAVLKMPFDRSEEAQIEAGM